MRELDPRDQSIAAAIQGHLDRHPDASDTARGIQDWWLPAQHRGRSVGDIERILWAMVDDGRLLATTLDIGAVVLFARNPRAPARG